MGSVYTAEETRSQIARRLSILPAIIGVTGVGLSLLGALAAGITDEPRGWTWAAAVAFLALTTVATGASFGLYLGLAALTGAGVFLGEPPSSAELIALTLTVLAVHETIRFSLDARRPSRFGPGLVGGYLARSAVTAIVVALAVVVLQPLADGEPQPAAWIPIGLAAAAVPLFALHLGPSIDRLPAMGHPLARAATAAVLTTAVLAVVVVGAQARTAIESTTQPTVVTPTTAPSTTVAPIAPAETDPASLQRVLTLVGVLILVIVIGVLYLALRRPEAVFELDELEPGLEDKSFGLAVPGRADQEDEVVDVDDAEVVALLQNLQLDMAGERDPGRAIRFGYANIERRLGELRLAREPAETEPEFLVRALPTLGPAGDALDTLTRLFELARFGHDEVGEAERNRAVVAIDDLLAELVRQGNPTRSPARRAEPGDGTEPR